MILTYGKPAQLMELQKQQWYMVELRSEKTVESTLKRLGMQLPAIFLDTAVEIFIPIEKRDINLFELQTGTYLFARSKNFHGLLRLRTITGVVGLVTLGDVNHPSKAIPVDPPYVAALIAATERGYHERTRTITLGSFVRILDGDERNFCGHVVDINPQDACVEVQIKTKILIVETPVQNLLDLSHVPAALQVFYFSPPVDALRRTEQEGLVAQDLHFEEDLGYVDDGFDVEQSAKRGRQQTVTALVKRLILTGTLSPDKIAVQVIAALKDGRLKSPKNLSIVHGIIKHRLIVDHFQQRDSGIVNYREVIARFGDAWRFPLHDFVAMGEGLSLPVSAPEPVAG